MAHILVVDDHEPGRYLMSALLEGRGHRVTAVGNGVEALEAARQTPPDMVISDVLMPRMDGFTLCHEWIGDERLSSIPFLFYSATYSDETDRDFALSIGAADYLLKPQEPEVLIAEIEGRLDGRISMDPIQGPLAESAFLAGYQWVVGRKLETKVAQIDALTRAHEATQRDYSRLFTFNPNCMWIYDRQTLDVLAVNDAAVDQYGYSEEEWLAMRITDFRPPEEVTRLLEDVRQNQTENFSPKATWTHLKKDGTRIQVEVSAHSMQFMGRAARVVTSIDVTERLAAEQRERDQLRRAEEAVLGIITVVSRIGEARDPYNSGHERRVALLAAAIACELGMDEVRMEGLRLAAAIHDIGKIAIPASILSKAGRLSEVEYALVREHAAAGYRLLKDLPFPWPLAEIVWQHHERSDGSGYPLGLAGDDILPEARILAVADSLEAMTSHRPYRAGCDIATALTELEGLAGTEYDAEVIAACIRLFRESGYALPH